jgi:hypothetical protein
MRRFLEDRADGMSLADKQWAKRADELQFKRVETIHATAGNWRNGLIALTALLTTVTILKGPEEASDLSSTGRMLAAVLLGIAFLLLILGSIVAMVAAYGFPGDEVLIDGDTLREWTAQEAKDSKEWLLGAIGCFLVGLVAVAGAVAVTWFDSDWFPPTPPAQLVVDLKSQSAQTITPVCGELKRGDSKRLVLKVKTATGERSRVIRLEGVSGLAIKHDCPK